MKKILVGLIATAAVILALPGAADAAGAKRFIATFDGHSDVRLSFRATDSKVSRIGIEISKSLGTGKYCSDVGISGPLDSAAIADGSFLTEIKPPESQPGTLFQVKGNDVPTSPTGTFRVKLHPRPHKFCDTGDMQWTASEATKAEWNEYREGL